MINFMNVNNGALTVLFSALVALATLVYAILTWRLVNETRRMRKAQTDANITVSVVITERWVNFLELLVKNEGVGPAYDIAFKLEPIDPEGCDKSIIDVINELGFVKNGLAFLSPGREIRSFLTSMLQDYEKKIKTVIKASVSYKTSSGERKEGSYIIDFSVFAGMRHIGAPSIHEIAQSMKAIEKNFDHLVSGFKRLEVVAYTKDENEAEREAEREEQEKVFREWNKSSTE